MSGFAIQGGLFSSEAIFKAGPLFDIRAYGAVSGGSAATNATAIVAAKNAATNAGGGRVYVPYGGVYDVSARIVLTSNVMWTGGGEIRGTTGVTTAVFTGLGGTPVSNVIFDGIIVDGGFGNGITGSVSGVQITNGTGIVVRNCTVQNVSNTGVHLATCPDSRVYNNSVTGFGLGGGSTNHGIHVINGSHRSYVQGNTVIGIAGSVGMGIRVGATGNGSTDCKVIGNYVDQANNSIFECIGVTSDCLRTQVIGNTALNGRDQGISFSCADSVCADNIVSGANFHGIGAAGDNCTITGNRCLNNGQVVSVNTYGGISLNGVSNCTVTGNRCYDDQGGGQTQDYGIKESSGADNNVLSGNNLNGNLTAPYLLTGASTTVVGSPSEFEVAAGQSVPSSTVNFTSVVALSGSAYGFYRQNSAPAQNDEAVFRLPTRLLGGTWTFAVTYVTGTGGGIFTVATSVDGVTFTDQGTVDSYNGSTVAFNRTELAALTIPGDTRYLRVKMATKNGSSTGYNGKLSGLSGVRTGV